MEKRIVALSSNPHTVSLADRKCSLFIDPSSGSIFVDEGDGEGRMNGVVFSPRNEPSFSVRPSAGPDHRLVLDYSGVQYTVGVSDNGNELRRWAESANLLLSEKRKVARVGDPTQFSPTNRMKRARPLEYKARGPDLGAPIGGRAELWLEYAEC